MVKLPVDGLGNTCKLGLIFSMFCKETPAPKLTKLELIEFTEASLAEGEQPPGMSISMRYALEPLGAFKSVKLKFVEGTLPIKTNGLPL